MEKIKVIVSWEDNYGAISEDVPGCIALGSSLEEVKREYAEGLKFHLEGLKEEDIPPKTKGDYELVFELDTHALLNYYSGILSRAALSRVTGINERQLGHYATNRSKPRPATRQKIVDGIHHIGREFISVV